jgi:hypothetical protein
LDNERFPWWLAQVRLRAHHMRRRSAKLAQLIVRHLLKTFAKLADIEGSQLNLLHNVLSLVGIGCESCCRWLLVAIFLFPGFFHGVHKSIQFGQMFFPCDFPQFKINIFQTFAQCGVVLIQSDGLCKLHRSSEPPTA